MKSMKSELQKVYDEYEGEKASFPLFYSRCREKRLMTKIGKPEFKELALTEITPEKKYTKITSVKYSKEYEYYHSYKGENPHTTVFRSRLRYGYTQEQAILVGEEWEKVKSYTHECRRKKINMENKHRDNMNINKKIKELKVEKPKKKEFIDIRYMLDEAKVFRIFYQEEIERLEYSLELGDFEGKKRLDSLKEEYEVFEKFNS